MQGASKMLQVYGKTNASYGTVKLVIDRYNPDFRGRWEDTTQVTGGGYVYNRGLGGEITRVVVWVEYSPNEWYLGSAAGPVSANCC